MGNIKRVRATAAAATHEGDDNTPSSPTGRGVKTSLKVYSRIYKAGILSLNKTGLRSDIDRVCSIVGSIYIAVHTGCL